MIDQVESRIPVPVAAAVLILVLMIAGSIGEVLTTDSVGVAGLIIPVLFLALPYGLWRRSGRARFWTTVFSTLAVAQGIISFAGFDALWLSRMAGVVVVVGLLLVPASSRRWFHDVR